MGLFTFTFTSDKYVMLVVLGSEYGGKMIARIPDCSEHHLF